MLELLGLALIIKLLCALFSLKTYKKIPLKKRKRLWRKGYQTLVKCFKKKKGHKGTKKNPLA